MAYTTEDGKGPYPCYEGEYCGNHTPGTKPLRSPHETPEQAERHERVYLAKMRFGRPHACVVGTSAELAVKGWVGLYLKKDEKVYDIGDGVILIDTPDELREPAA